MPTLSSTLEKKYGTLYLELRAIVNEIDPVSLKGRLPLEGEYDPEIALILSALRECRSFDEIHRLVYNIFLRKFDPPVAGSPKRYKPIAARISELLGNSDGAR